VENQEEKDEKQEILPVQMEETNLELSECEDEEEGEEEGEEEEEDAVDASSAAAESEEQPEVEMNEEVEVIEVEIKGKPYFTTDEMSGVIYACTPDGDIGDEVGKFVGGKPVFAVRK
jgi:hypothetical protein